jgi:iron complex outermembrane recepter protein
LYKSQYKQYKKNFYGFSTLICFITRETTTKAAKQKNSSRQFVRERQSEWGKTRVRGCHKILRISIVLLSLLISTSSFADKAPQSFEQQRFDIDVPANNVAEALNMLAEQTDSVLLFPYKEARARQANAVSGRYTLMEALIILLQGSGLNGSLSENGAIKISLVEGARLNHEIEGKQMNSKKITKKKSFFAAVSAVLLSVFTPAMVSGEEVGDKSEIDSVLEEVIVTAEKREKNLQKVPIAISVFSEGVLRDRGISTPEDLQFSTPSLVVGATVFGGAIVSVRGVGSENLGVGGDPGVPLHIDGHYVQSSSHILRNMFDIERVEILKGPQGTLYGRNAVGGNINIITKRPADSFEGQVSVDLGNYDKVLLQGMLSGPLSSRLRSRIVFSGENRDGYTENVATGKDNLEDADYKALRASFEYDLTERIQAYLTGHYFDDSSTPRITRLVDPYPVDPILAGFYVNPWAGAGVNITASDPRKVRLNSPVNNSFESKGGSFDIDWDMGAVIFRSLSSYDETKYSAVADIDGSDLVTLTQGARTETKTFTQELQLLSNNNDNLEWIFGLFYYNEDSSADSFLSINSFFGPGNPPTLIEIGPNEIDSQSLGVFGQVDYFVTDKLTASFGLRYSEDEKELLELQRLTDFGVVAPDGSPLTQELDDKWDKITWKLGLNYAFSRDVMLYASYSTGYKAGGFNTGTFQATSYEPETVDSLEFGIKSRLWQDRIQLNVSGYFYDYKDKQELRYNELVSAELINAAAATVEGLEFELQARLIPELLVDFNFSYQKSEYDEFTSLDVSNAALGVQDLSGNQLNRSPKWKAYIGAQYEWGLGEYGSLSVRADYNWTDEQFYQIFNQASDKLPKYHRINARISWESNDGQWSADFYAKNIENDDVRSNGVKYAPTFDSVRTFEFFAPRTYGVTLNYNF